MLIGIQKHLRPQLYGVICKWIQYTERFKLKNTRRLPGIINSVKQRFIKNQEMSGEYKKPNNILSKIDTMPLGDYFLTGN